MTIFSVSARSLPRCRALLFALPPHGNRIHVVFFRECETFIKNSRFSPQILYKFRFFSCVCYPGAL